ncbi:hypothetical protein BDV06DRAFT_226610 [Aspergillus oleicola]
MPYQVGRACTVANYVGLYKELELLPDIRIVEEARDNKATEIFDSIMASPVKYDVMNDYNRTVNLESPKVALYLNSGTAVRSSLDIKQEHGAEWVHHLRDFSQHAVCQMVVLTRSKWKQIQ